MRTQIMRQNCRRPTIHFLQCGPHYVGLFAADICQQWPKTGRTGEHQFITRKRWVIYYLHVSFRAVILCIIMVYLDKYSSTRNKTQEFFYFVLGLVRTETVTTITPKYCKNKQNNEPLVGCILIPPLRYIQTVLN